MSEIYKRSLGYTYDEDALRREVDAGTAGYDSTPADVPSRPLDVVHIEQYRDLEVIADMETQFFLAEEAMREVAIEHPKYTWHVGQVLSERLDEMKRQEHPVDAEMYIEAQDLAEEIVAANPDKNAQELSQIVETMVGMIQAEYKMRQYALVA